MGLPRSIKDAKTAIVDIRDVAKTLDGVVLNDIVSLLTNAADEIEGYLLSDAAEALDEIAELESQVSELEKGS